MDERMSEFEALMWYLDQDPLLSPTMANLTLLGGTPDLTRFRNRLDFACRVMPRLIQRPVGNPGHVAPPVWRTDPGFDLDRHLKVIALPGRRGGLEAVRSLVPELYGEVLDTDHPPWRFTLITGLPRGRTAMVQRLHHAITDGEGGLRLSLAFLDFEAHPEGDRPLLASLHGDPETTGSDDTSIPPAEVGPPGVWRETLEALGHRARTGVEQIGRVAGTIGEGLRDPRSVGRWGSDLAGLAGSLGRQVRSVDQGAGSLWAERSHDRVFEWLDFPLEEVRSAAHSLGVTINDVFVTAIADAAGTYRAERGDPVELLTGSIPISTRRSGAAGANLFAPAVASLPTGESLPLRERLRRTHEVLHQAKTDPSLSSVEPLVGLVNVLPIPLILRAGRWVTAHVDVVASNLRASPSPMYLGGAEVLANYPVGPLSGSAVNVTMMSYCGQMNIGLHADAACVDDPQQLRDGIADSLAAVCALA